MPSLKNLLSACLLTAAASAHFVLEYPTSLGFDDDLESTGPCGGFSIPSAGSTNSTDVTVGAFAVALRSTHPAADFLYRASPDLNAANLQNILPVVSETGIGQFCLPALSLPSSFTGKTGFIQVIQDGPDGTLYQCAVVNYVAGMNTTIGSACTNGTGLTATITNQSNFTSGASSSVASVASTASTSGASTSIAATTAAGVSTTAAGSATSAAAASATSSHSAAVANIKDPKWAGLAALLAVPVAFL